MFGMCWRHIYLCDGRRQVSIIVIFYCFYVYYDIGATMSGWGSAGAGRVRWYHSDLIQNTGIGVSDSVAPSS